MIRNFVLGVRLVEGSVAEAIKFLAVRVLCASIAGSGGLFCENALQSIIAAHPRSDPGVQQVKCKEDRAFSRDLLKRVGGQGARAFAHLYVAICHR